MKRTVLAGLLVAIAAVAPAANAHNDPNSDPTRCDGWQRAGQSHDQTDPSDVNAPGGTRVHAVYGNNYVMTPFGYVQVVGGNAYKGPDPQGRTFPGQGGFVQGELDPVPGGPDADFNVALFGPDTDHPPTADPTSAPQWANGAYGRACVNVAGTQVTQQTRNP